MRAGTTRRLVVNCITDCIKSMDEDKWDEMASLYLLRKLEEKGVVISVREDHTLNELDDVRAPDEGPRPETPPTKVGRHGGH